LRRFRFAFLSPAFGGKAKERSKRQLGRGRVRSEDEGDKRLRRNDGDSEKVNREWTKEKNDRAEGTEGTEEENILTHRSPRQGFLRFERNLAPCQGASLN
jgi:hypothetical protein